MVTERRRAGWGRVEVGELAPPERIDVPRFIPDNYVKPAQAPINNDLERLAQGLGAFNRGLQQFGAKVEADHKKKATEDAYTRWNHWLSSTSDIDQLNAIKDGRVHWARDPYIGHIARAHFGQLTAQHLAAEIDNDPTFRDNMGKPDFDIEKYIIEKAAPYASRMASSKESMESFRKGLDAIRRSGVQRHTEARGKIQAQMLQDMAAFELDKVLDAVLPDKEDAIPLNGEQIAGILGDTYKELGRRINGGSLDLSYGQLDDLLLKSLKERAKDIRQVRAIEELLKTERIDSGSGMRLGTLGSSTKNREAVVSIAREIQGTLGKQWEEEARYSARRFASDALARGDTAAFNGLMDIQAENPYTRQTFKYSKSAIQEDAMRETLAAIRGPNGQENFNAEYDVFVKSDVEHPQWFPILKAAYHSIRLAGVDKNRPMTDEEMSKFIGAAERYERMVAAGGVEYVQKYLPKEARQFFDSYSVLVQHEGMNPHQAISQVIAANVENAQNPGIQARRAQEIENAARLDFNKWNPFSGDITNQEDARRELLKVANGIALYNRGSPDAVLKEAKKRLESSGFELNGRLVFGVAGMTPSDKPVVQSMLDKVWEQKKYDLQGMGVKSASDLSVTKVGQQLFITDKDGRLLTFTNGRLIGFGIAQVRSEEKLFKEREKKRLEEEYKVKGPGDPKRRRSLSPGLIRQEMGDPEPEESR